MDTIPPETIERWQADHAKFLRRQERRRIVALWSLIPYLAAAGAVGVGVARTWGDWLTFGLLAAGYFVMVSLQWIMPEVVRREDAKIDRESLSAD